MSWVFGLKAYLLLQYDRAVVAGSAGIWLFYVQHQFEGVYWERSGDGITALAALKGSSFYKLPKVLQWFSGNIGFHHIHHLSPRIPNYHLEKCHRAEPLFQTVKPVTLFSSLKSFTFRLWDEQRRRLVGLPRLESNAKAAATRGALTLSPSSLHTSCPEVATALTETGDGTGFSSFMPPKWLKLRSGFQGKPGTRRRQTVVSAFPSSFLSFPHKLA